VETEIADGVPVVVAAGEFDLATIQLLEDALARAITSGQEDVVLDLSGVDFFGSEALYTTLRGHARLDDQGRRLGIVCPAGGIVDHVLNIVGASRLIRIYRDRGTALGELGRRPR
jgi:anti-anti-sigma factor